MAEIVAPDLLVASPKINCMTLLAFRLRGSPFAVRTFRCDGCVQAWRALVMSLHRLTAGAGYRYLMRHTSCGDADRDPATPLTAYYTDSGYPPGRWIGSGLAGLAAGHGLRTGTQVGEEAMARLFSRGHDPATDAKLGRAYPTTRPAADRVAARLAALPLSLTREQRETLTEQIRVAEQARQGHTAVAGFDLTFTVPKSASIRWALGDTATQAAISTAHAAAVADAISFLEAHALFTRTGTDGVTQVQTRGAIAAAFDHWDTRTGDPNLHTHVVLANKVQTPDGAWRALDSRALYQAAVAISEIYDDLFADHLQSRLPDVWEWRSRGARRSPAYELADIDDRLIREFSSRSVVITEAVRVAIGDLTRRFGRTPSRAEVLRLRQQVTRSTRPTKTVRRLAEQLANWRHRAGRLPAVPRPAIGAAASAVTAETLSAETVTKLAATVLDGVQERRSTWTRWNVLAETARTCRDIRLMNAAERHHLHERVTDVALAACVHLQVPDAFVAPTAYRRADGESAFTRHHENRHTSRAILDAERRLLAAHADLSAPTAIGSQLRGIERSEQASAVHVLVSSGRRVDALVGPAGAGKTATLQQFRSAWEDMHGAGSVIGLAPSATAARELAGALGIPCENTAKWLHESSRQNAETQWRIHPGQAVIVDEASLAGTLALDRIATQAAEAGAKMVLVGDHRQLDAVEAGGAFGLLATWGRPVELVGLWRFRNRWEANATRQLRDGDPACLDVYERQDRLHHGPFEIAVDAAYTAARAAEAAGKSALLVALDNGTVEALNERARADRIAEGLAAMDAVELRDGVKVGVGDRIVTRRNNRRVSYGENDFVRNGALWDVVAIQPGGALNARLLTDEPSEAHVVRLPSDYVREHVELGYATTLHRAQGTTVDSAHIIATASVTREVLYVGMSRGREENHCYLATDVGESDAVPDVESDPRTVFESILGRSGVEPSATQALVHARALAFSPERLGPITTTVLADAAGRRWSALLRGLDYPANVVRTISASPANGPLITMLQNGVVAGYDMTAVMRSLAESVPDDPRADPAEYLHERVQRWLRERESAEQAISPAQLRELQLENGILDSAEPDIARLLAQLRDAAVRRTASSSTDARQAWLPPSPRSPDARSTVGRLRLDPKPPSRSPQP